MHQTIGTLPNRYSLRIAGDSCCGEGPDHLQSAIMGDLKPINPYTGGQSIQEITIVGDAFIDCGNAGRG